MHKPAFEARLDNIEDELLNNEEALREQSWRVCHRLAELIFLATVVPRQSEESLTQEALSNNMQQLLVTLKSGGKEAVRQVLQDLRWLTDKTQAAKR